MSRPISAVNSPINRAKLPKRVPQPSLDIYIFPFYPALGFKDDGLRLNVSSQLYNSIIQGNKPIVLKWENSEGALEWDDKTLTDDPDGTIDPDTGKVKRVPTKFSRFLRNLKLGNSFIGKTITSDYSVLFENKNTGFSNANGEAVNYIEQSIQRRIVIHTTTRFFFQNENTDVLDSSLQRLFFIIPELSGKDVLIIENMSIFRDDTQGGKIDHLEITFLSLGDKLAAIGKTLNGLVSFGGAGEENPFPEIRPDQPGNSSLFYNTNSTENDIPNSKRIYFEPSLKDNTDGVKKFQIDFNGLAKVFSIEFYGREKLAPEIINAGTDTEKTIYPSGRVKKLLLHNVGYPIKENYNVAVEKQFVNVRGILLNLNWFQNYTDEIGLNYDPTKSRENTGILWLETEGTGFAGQNWLLGDNTSQLTNIYGRNYLAMSQWSDYELTPTQEIPDGEIKVNDNFFEEDRPMTLTDFLNLNGIYQHNNSILEYGGIKVSNNKDFVKKIVDGVITTTGVIATFASGGVAPIAIASVAALHVAQQLSTTVFGFLSSSFFDKASFYHPAVVSSGLLPKRFLEDVYAKLGSAGTGDLNEKHRIPLSLFNEPENNYLSGMLNSKTYGVSFSGEITNKFVLKSKTQVESDERDTIVFSNPIKIEETDTKPEIDGGINIDDNTIHSRASASDFIIDFVVVKALTKAPIKIWFYTNDNRVLWRGTMLTQSGFSGNILEFETSFLLSDITDGKKSSLERYRLPAYKKRVPEATEGPEDAEEKKAKAEEYLNGLETIDIVDDIWLEFGETSEKVDYSKSGIYWFYMNWEDRKSMNSTSATDPFVIPRNVIEQLNLYYYIEINKNPTFINTTKKRIAKLKEKFKFNKIEMSNSSISVETAWQEWTALTGSHKSYTFDQDHYTRAVSFFITPNTDQFFNKKLFHIYDAFLPRKNDSGGLHGQSNVRGDGTENNSFNLREYTVEGVETDTTYVADIRLQFTSSFYLQLRNFDGVPVPAVVKFKTSRQTLYLIKAEEV